MYKMPMNIYFLSIQLLILCHRCTFIDTKPMLGQQVRLAERNEFPYVVSMVQVAAENQNNLQFYHLCTGTLITRTDVAISEHCIEGEHQTAIQISVGSLHFGEGQKYRILWWLSYDQWIARHRLQSQFTDRNDIANIRLTNAVRNSIIPVRFFDVPNNRLYGAEVRVVGWGSPNNTQPSPLLKTATLNVLSNRECKRRIRNIIERNVILNEYQYLCSAGNPYVILNQGDSGAPLLYGNRLVGITSGSLPNILGEIHPDLINLHSSLRAYKHFYLNVMSSDGN